MKIFKSKFFITILLLLLTICIGNVYCSITVFHYPTVPKVNISELTKINRNINENDYIMLFEQTGVAPAVSKEIIESGNSPMLKKLQSLWYQPKKPNREYIFFPLTAEERVSSQTPLAPLKNGDILITFNTHTLFWRHGHCGIVTDAKYGEVLEHRSIGSVSSFGYAPSWGTYPAFVILRHKDEEKAQKAAEYAKDHLVNVDYNILAGVFKKDKSDEEKPSSSHCSHIVWQAFKSVGADIDSNGGLLVTPRDIAMSDELSVIQIFGLNTDDYSDRVLK